MELKELTAQRDAIIKEAQETARKLQDEINQLAQLAQTKVREAQKYVDNQDGRVQALNELIDKFQAEKPKKAKH